MSTDLAQTHLLRPPTSGHEDDSPRTIWGLTPDQLHDRFWASRGVYVVRPQENGELPPNAELFMLTDARTLAVFALGEVASQIYWNQIDVLFVRVRQPVTRQYRERVAADSDGNFLSFSRVYELPARRASRIALTRDRELAEAWQNSPADRRAWTAFRRHTRSICSDTYVTSGMCFDRSKPEDLEKLTKSLAERWTSPDLTVEGIIEVKPRLWVASDTQLDAEKLRTAGTIWVGSGRTVPARGSLVGPAVLWDEPTSRPQRTQAFWTTLEPTEQTRARSNAIIQRSRSFPRRLVRRGFDIAFSLTAILLTSPFYPLIALAILIEDGRPIFFRHRRETTRGREFGCLKFRTMRKNAEEIKKALQQTNESDGPQFFMRNDPRITVVGRFLRATNLDEIPQFFNVLSGDMSVVGPRPSPKHENQYCPAWREARLSVKPGITGLWQVSRTRRQGLDFQEWIRFDMEYVERQGFWLDLKIIIKTVIQMLRRG